MCTIVDLFLLEIESSRHFRNVLGLCRSFLMVWTVGEIAVDC